MSILASLRSDCALGLPMAEIVVSSLSRLAEAAVRHKSSEMISLLAKGQSFHRPAVIAGHRHLVLDMNDIAVARHQTLIAPGREHVERLVEFARAWDRTAPLLVHCWMGVSRSPAAAMICALAIQPEQDDDHLAKRLRKAAPFATPNARLIEIADDLLARQGRLISAVEGIGRGRDYQGDGYFSFSAFGEAA